MTPEIHRGFWASSLSLVVVLSVVAGILDAADTRERQSEKSSAREILDATGVKGGLIVHVGCGDGKLTAALRTAPATWFRDWTLRLRISKKLANTSAAVDSMEKSPPSSSTARTSPS